MVGGRSVFCAKIDIDRPMNTLGIIHQGEREFEIEIVIKWKIDPRKDV